MDRLTQEEPVEVIDLWACKLAREVAPEEGDLAPFWAQAYAAGGAARKELYAATGTTIGGFLADGIAPVLPIVFQALSSVSAALVSALASRYAADFLGCVKNGLTVLEINQQAGQSPLRAAKPPAAQVAIPAAEPYAPLKRLVETMGRELRAQGLGEDQCDLVTFRTLKVLLEEPQGGSQFVQEITASR